MHKLQTEFQRYFNNMFAVTSESGLGNISSFLKDYDGVAVNIADENLRHLHDHIIKSQIVRIQKNRLFRRLHNVSNTIIHMRKWHAAEKERERYYQEKYGSAATYLDSHSNKILRDERVTYDCKYVDEFYNMFKYLDSSVEIEGDILNMAINEARAKGKLCKAGADIFAPETEELTYRR